MSQINGSNTLMSSPVPDDILYHYTSAEGLIGISQGEFWVTERHFLNDQSEFSLGTKTVIDIIKSHVHPCERLDKLTSALEQEMKRIDMMAKLEDDFAFAGDYVISFCLEPDNELLWAKYSDFQGYCLGFSLSELEKGFQDNCLSWNRAVVYDPQEQVNLVEKTFVEDIFTSRVFDYFTNWNSISAFTNEQIRETAMFLSVVCDSFNMFFKRACFAGEKEYRFVFSHIHDKGRIKPEDRIPLHFRVHNGVLIPFVKMQFNAAQSLKSTLIGPRNTSDIAEKGLEYFFRNLGMAVTLSKSVIPLRY